MLGAALVRRNQVDVQVDSLELSTGQNHHDREPERTVHAFPFQRTWTADLEGEPIADIERSGAVQRSLQLLERGTPVGVRIRRCPSTVVQPGQERKPAFQRPCPPRSRLQDATE